MPGCAAVGCNNRSEKGYIMKCFPRDPKLRKIWQERVARADWEPSNNSFLCHVHFEPEEWSIMPNGRIRLKKNAIPSIFTVTSTRKSPKKRGKLANFKNQNQCENDYTMEYLENDTEHSSIGFLEEKDSDSQDIDDPSVKSFVYQQVNHSTKTTENKQITHRQYRNVTSDLQQESIILISDDNIEIISEDNIKEGNNEKQTNMENKKSSGNCIADENLTNNQNDIVIKTEIKREHDQTSLDSYDEIEEKLKQICDGGREESISNNVERLNSTSNNREGVLEKSITQIPILHRSINYKYSSRDEIGSLLTDDTENIEIIFGSESGEECARVPKCTSYDNNETTEFNKTDQSAANIVSVTDDQEINKSFPEAIEKAFQGENIHVTPNIRAAIKRKRRTRKEIMKSIKKSIRNASSHDTNSVSDSDISDNIIEAENEIGKELNTSESTRLKDDTVPAITKFTVKVSGDREDIFDIMQDFSKDTKDFIIQECNNTYIHQGNNTFVTSIITIDDSPMEAFVKDEYSDDITPTSITSRDQVSFNLSPLKNNECLSTKLMSPHFDEENGLHVNSYSILDVNSEQPTANCTTKYECRKLRQKVKIQEDVIKKLSNQLILYKNSEKNLQNKNSALEIKTKKMENMMYEFNTKTDNAASSMIYKKNMDLKQKLIDDLTNRVNYLEEVNKKLMKTVTVESQYKRKLEGQIKQRDNRIKELNWKLEKASKFLDRAEKNTNTYRRKMLNMQTFMRRKKLLDEKMSRFNEMLIDNVKDGYTEKAVAMAIEIKEICGSSGYDKLLNFGFPLPSLSALRTPPRDISSDSNESSNTTPRAGPSKRNISEETGIQCANDDVEANTKNQILESVCEEIDVTDNTEETVMGTVQDIFEENNDVDDFGTNELREHFILQLNAVM